MAKYNLVITTNVDGSGSYEDPYTIPGGETVVSFRYAMQANGQTAAFIKLYDDIYHVKLDDLGVYTVHQINDGSPFVSAEDIKKAIKEGFGRRVEVEPQL